MTHQGEQPERDVPSLSVDAILDVLAHHHRRALLRSLREAPGHQMPEDEVINLFQQQEESRTGKQPSWDHLSASLHHVHEPKLSEAGLITYDESDSVYQYHTNERVEKYLDLIESEHDPAV